MTRRSTPLVLALTLAALAAGCATKGHVRTELTALEERTDARLDDVEGQVEANQTRLDEQAVEIAELSTTAREALERAIAAGKLAEGKFLYETVLTDDAVRFGFDRAELSDTARGALDTFAGGLTRHGQDIYIEIQGHTDDIGTDGYNLELGARRAESVRRYLSRQAGLPLHRMAVISYGETAPVAPNGSREDRARNRRVALVVLR